jgi:hypothetical protein
MATQSGAKQIALYARDPLTERTIFGLEGIVRETLAIARECSQVLAADLQKDRLLVELVSSLVVARLRKGDSK